MPDGGPLINPDIVAARISSLLFERRCGAVKPLLAALEKLKPDHAELPLLRAAYFCQLGDADQALAVLEAETCRRPRNAVPHLRRAEILFGQSDYAGAALAAAEAVLLAPDFARAKSTLGLALLGLQKFDEALPCLQESFDADPSTVDGALALAALQPALAEAILNRAIAAAPRSCLLRSALIRSHLCKADIAQALAESARTRADGTADAETYCLQAFAEIEQHSWDDALASIAQAQSLAPENPWAARLASALACRQGGELCPVMRPDALAAERALRAGAVWPEILCAVLAQARPEGPVLDLFCGAGLAATAAAAISPGPWTGVEPDPVLLQHSAQSGLYARLENRAPRAFLESAGEFDVILLNEALGYHASPRAWFAGLRAALRGEGIALAAIPIGRPGLNGHGLFAHSLDGITAEAAQAGLIFQVEHSGILRHSEGIPLHGVIASFRTR